MSVVGICKWILDVNTVSRQVRRSTRKESLGNFLHHYVPRLRLFLHRRVERLLCLILRRELVITKTHAVKLHEAQFLFVGHLVERCTDLLEQALEFIALLLV